MSEDLMERVKALKKQSLMLWQVSLSLAYDMDKAGIDRTTVDCVERVTHAADIACEYLDNGIKWMEAEKDD